MAFAKTLLDSDNTKFASLMVRMLNTILMTAHELVGLRQKLNTLKDEVNYYGIIKKSRSCKFFVFDHS